MPQHARALAGAACALALSASMFAPAAFADDDGFCIFLRFR